MSNTTIRDVAREASVSVASVSRALNGASNVRPELRDHIREVAKRLGYVPHAGARNLSLARSSTIGVVVPDLHGEFFSELLRGMDRQASELGLHLLLMVMHGEADRGVTALHAMRGRVDGLVVMAPQISSDELFAHLPSSMPSVLVNCARREGVRPELRVDNVGGAVAMIEHLAAGGCRRVVHIAGPQDNIDAQERLRGTREACARLGLDLRVLQGDFNEDSGTAAIAALQAEGANYDAVFAANDNMAVGALMALKRAGVAVPDEVAVAGFDNIPLTRLISPALTTASIDIAEFGARAVVRLAGLIDGATDDTLEWRAPIAIARESTRPIPKNTTENPIRRGDRE